MTPCHEFSIAKGYKTPEEDDNQVSLIHFEPDIPAHIKEVFNRFNDDERFFTMRYWSVSHYKKFFTKDDELVTNDVLYGRETASCYYTDIKPMSNESEFMIKKIAEKYGYDKGALRNYLKQWSNIKHAKISILLPFIIIDNLED